MSRVRIVVDERERRSGIPDILIPLGADVDYASLKVGDYIISYECCVERKSLRDLINSIYDGRVFLQLRDMLSNYSSPVVIVEGYADELKEDEYNIMYGALASIVVDYKVPVISTYSKLHTAYMLLALARRYMNEKRGESKGPLLRRIDKGVSLREQQISVVASLPGIGSRLAVKLLDRFSTPLNVFNASLAELARVIGYARAERIRRMLEYNANADAVNVNTGSLDDYTSE